MGYSRPAVEGAAAQCSPLFFPVFQADDGGAGWPAIMAGVVLHAVFLLPVAGHHYPLRMVVVADVADKASVQRA